MKRKHPHLCFVIMPFEDGMKRIYTDAIRSACEQAKFDVLRSDDLDGPYNIHRNIIQYIFSSDVVIADLTQWNPNVFYEMGVAHAIGNKTIMIIRDGEELPFDIVNYQCIKYSTADGGMKALQAKLEKSLRAFDDWRTHPTNPVQLHKPHDAFVVASEMLALRKLLSEKEQQLRHSIARAEHDKLKAELQKIEKALQAKEKALLQAGTDLQKTKDELAAKSSQLEQALERLYNLKENNTETPPRRKASLALRSTPSGNLSEDAVKTMLKKYDFFCAEGRHWSNPAGKGIAHDYQLQQDKQVVFDAATGLYWQQGGSSKTITFRAAGKYIDELNSDKFAGFDDWRLPTLEEAMSLMEREKKNGDLYIDPIFAAAQGYIWTEDRWYPAGLVCSVFFFNGKCFNSNVNLNRFVRAVRS